MTINSLYIYDRHCICIYYHDWLRTRRPKPAVEGGILPAVSQTVMAVPSTDPTLGSSSTYNSPRNTLSSTTGTVVALNEGQQLTGAHEHVQAQAAVSRSGISSTGLAFDEEVKLVYGVVLSLRNIVKKISGRDEQFVNYRTSTYKVHLFETLSGYKFVMFTDAKTDSLRFALRQIYMGPFVDYVVRNPLVKMDSKEHGIDNEYFRTSVDRLVRGLSVFA